MNSEQDENPLACEVDQQTGRATCCGPGDLSKMAKPVTRNLPKAKQTALGLYLTAREAYEKWKADSHKVKVLDVRTLEEYIYVGHPEMAVNIPLAIQTYQWNGEKGHFDYKPNAEFLEQVKEWAQPSAVLLVMCRSGGRSAMAINALAKAGFTNAWNITDGMEGDADSDGKRTVNGWKNAGTPWTYEVDPVRVRLPQDDARSQ